MSWLVSSYEMPPINSFLSINLKRKEGEIQKNAIDEIWEAEEDRANENKNTNTGAHLQNANNENAEG